MQIQSAKDLIVYQKAYDLSMRIFEATKKFPLEERYALTGQIRRSSRSVCNNLREAWAKRMYPPHFVSKLTDCAGEINETDTSLDFAKDCKYITESQHAELVELGNEVGRMLNAMIFAPEKFLLNNPTIR
jgi:four helix bundle protein